MLLEILLFLVSGIIAGTITGLIPGIHINLIGVFLISLSSSILASINPIYFGVFIVAMAITHTFIDFIPSIFLGCPDTDTELSILPGHELLKNGHGYEAVILTAYGSIAAIVALIIISLPVTLFLPQTYSYIEKWIPYLLIGATTLLILSEQKQIKALFVIFLTGALGYLSLNLSINQPLLPLLTGLFGSSALIMSIRAKTQIPKQKIKIPKKQIAKPLTGAIIGSLIASPLCCLLPGLGSGQAAVIGNLIVKTNQRGFLILLGATNTLVMGFSFLSLYLISKTRTGAAVAVQEIIGTISPKILILVLIVIVFSGIISFFITIYLAEKFANKIHSFNYTLTSIITLILLIFIVLGVSGIWGLLVLAASTITGIYCISLGVRRTNMMGCLMIPTILLYLV